MSEGPVRACCEDYLTYRQREPEPTIEDYCHPHPYYGDDCGMGRCYCGQRTYPKGGPT